MSQGSTGPPYPQGHVLGISHFTGVVAGTEPCSDLHSFTASSQWPHSRTWGVSPRVGSMAGSLSPEHAFGWVLGYAEVPCLGACTPWVQSQSSRAGALPPTQSQMRQGGAGQERSSSKAPHSDPAHPAQPLIQPPFTQRSPSPSTAPHPAQPLIQPPRWL